MAKTDVLALIQLLAADQADAGAIANYYDDEIRRVALGPGWVTETSMLTAVVGTAVYTPPTSAARQLALFYDDRVLSLENPNTIPAAHGVSWRSKIGPPDSYLLEHESSRDFRVVPAPDMATEDRPEVFGELFGRDYPAGTIALIHTDQKQDVPVWMETLLALRVLAREFSRTSDHRDDDFAALCSRLADLVFLMVA